MKTKQLIGILCGLLFLSCSAAAQNSLNDHEWLEGNWTDGENIFAVTRSKIVIFNNWGEVINTATFSIEDEYINAQWMNEGFEVGLLVNDYFKTLAYEGGSELLKLPEWSVIPTDGRPIISLFDSSSKSYNGDMNWLYGLWKMEGTELYIAPEYYQVCKTDDQNSSGENVFELEKRQYQVKEVENQILGNVIRFDKFYIDPIEKLVYTVSGLGRKSYMVNQNAAPDVKSSDNRLEGYEWLAGNWIGRNTQQVFVKITPQYYQLVGEMWNEDMNLANAEKKEYVIKVVHNEFLGDVKGICDGLDSDYATIYLDEAKKAIYWVYDFDSKVYLSKE